MASTPTLMGIPTELRFLIIKLVSWKSKKRAQIPCCREHDPEDSDWGWHREAGDNALIPRGVRDVLRLMQVNKQLFVEVQETFFSGVAATFCTHYSPHVAEAVSGLTLARSPYHHFSSHSTSIHAYLQHFRTVRFNMRVPNTFTNDYSDLANSVSMSVTLRRFEMMDMHRLFVEALNTSHNLKELDLCCTFLGPENFISSKSLEYVFRAYKQLRPEVKLDVHLHAFSVENHEEIPLPHNGFPDWTQTEHVENLQHRNKQAVPKPSFINEWILLREWLYSTLPQLSDVKQHDNAGDIGFALGRRYRDFNDKTTPFLVKAVSDVWYAHDKGEKKGFNKARKELEILWGKICEQRGRVITEGVQVLDEPILQKRVKIPGTKIVVTKR